MKTRRRDILFCLILNSVLGLLFVRAEFWNFNDGLLHEIIYLAAIFAVCILVPFLVYRNTEVQKLYLYLYNQAVKCIQYLKSNIKTILITAGKAVCTVGVFTVLMYAASKLFQFENNYILSLAACTAGLILYIAWHYRKTSAEKAERVFFLLAVTAGMFFIMTAPAEVGICWDDNFHYDGTIAMVTVNGAYYASDAEIIDHVADVALDKKFYDRESRAQRTELVNGLYADGEMMPYNHANLGLNTITYIPFGVGLVIGRGLRLPYTWIFRLEKICNLLFYAAVIAAGMKRLQFGKLLAAVIGLIPTGLFMASSFSYDPWIISLSMLGFCYFFGYLQDENSKITNRDMVIMIGAFFLACLPKAVYFVIMFPLLFMPKDRFQSVRQRRWYYISGFTFAAVLAGSFILPRLLHGAGSGDSRGGSDVNAAEQVRFILENPMRYARILFHFFLSYLNPVNAFQYMVNYAYLGFGKIFHLSTVTLFFAAVMDKNGRTGKTKAVTFSTMFAVMCAIILVATAMYISYTAVASETVAGCQYRYLIPIVLPALYVNSFDRLKNPLDKNLFMLVPQLIMVLVFVCDTALALSSLY